MSELKAGETAPDFETIDDQGKKLKLSDFRGRRVVLYFYPKDDTPGCTAQACGFRDSHDAIEERNAVVLGVSTDDVKSHQAFKEKHGLNFPLLVDTDHKIADAYGVWGERSFAGRTYMGIGRSHFVIDENGKLVDVQYGIRPADSVDKALEALT
jgi:thioredoxin-dependent peroxiredoxin